MTETTTIIIDFWGFIVGLASVLATFSIVVWTFGTVLVRQFKEHLDARFQARDAELLAMTEKLEKVEEQGRHVENELLRLRAELPREYVQREDWIRFSGSIDMKLDHLRSGGDSLRLMVLDLFGKIRSNRDAG